jgi:hypothetical protein
VLVDALTNAAGGIRTAVVQALAAQASLLILVGAALLIGSWLLGRRAASRLAADAGPAPAGSPYPTHEPSERPSGIFG